MSFIIRDSKYLHVSVEKEGKGLNFDSFFYKKVVDNHPFNPLSFAPKKNSSMSMAYSTTTTNVHASLVRP